MYRKAGANVFNLVIFLGDLTNEKEPESPLRKARNKRNKGLLIQIS